MLRVEAPLASSEEGVMLDEDEEGREACFTMTWPEEFSCFCSCSSSSTGIRLVVASMHKLADTVILILMVGD